MHVLTGMDAGLGFWKRVGCMGGCVCVCVCGGGGVYVTVNPIRTRTSLMHTFEAFLCGTTRSLTIWSLYFSFSLTD